jgi:1-acyl-sn-glycerol-3-phosphate acyltransferase
MRGFLQKVLALAYGMYAWLLFLTISCAALVAALVVPGLHRRRAAARAFARLFLRGAGMPLAVRHPERIPAGQCVIVANHASYLDGPVFTAALPPRFGFVIKREMAGVPLAGALLARIGSHFVERFDRHRGAADARRVLRSAIDGHSLVFFPEGTFSHEPGLLRFHTGAFATAARAGCPIVPAVVRGTRVALPSNSLLPRPVAIEVEILPPIFAAAAAPDAAAVELRDRARSAILSELNEPDLAVA